MTEFEISEVVLFDDIVRLVYSGKGGGRGWIGSLVGAVEEIGETTAEAL